MPPSAIVSRSIFNPGNERIEEDEKIRKGKAGM
jgi:hypothetical protein